MNHTFTLRPLPESEPPARPHPDPDTAFFPFAFVTCTTPRAEPASSDTPLGSDVEDPTVPAGD